MTSSLRLSPHAIKPYTKLEASVKSAVQAALDALQAHPLHGPKIKRLKGRLREYFRYRVGDYRIVYMYMVDPHARIVSVDYMQHRKDIYRSAGA